MSDRHTANRRQRQRRHERVRKHVAGSSDRPRLCVARSSRHISAQIIDDEKGHTLCAVTTTAHEVGESLRDVKGQVEKSRRVGRLLAERARAAGVTKVVFDRGGFRYHGRVKALAEGARESGLLEF
ncbi:MAG: 50S ribosomal protein L18 [Candidatus Eisenbacteria bacterium]|jgi:large subunit ribosomal protein L18|nr:50S ribosomal protein L18 [Candidatus Eisenbacteria bacterium]